MLNVLSYEWVWFMSKAVCMSVIYISVYVCKFSGMFCEVFSTCESSVVRRVLFAILVFFPKCDLLYG